MDLTEFTTAHRRIGEHIRRTPVEPSPVLGRMGDCRVHLKLENMQSTGSFKLRGAMNKLLSLGEDQRRRGVVAASSGNHGAAVAFGARRIGVRAEIFVPESAAAGKIAAIESHGAEVHHEGKDCVVAEQRARQSAAEGGMTYISPYNDLDVVAGQGSLGLELHEQLPELDAVFVALGGGGLISGVAAALRAAGREVEVIACSPVNSAVMHESMRAGKILELESLPTLSDGTAGGVEDNALTFPLCQELIDHSVTVSEKEIAQAMRLIIEHHHQLIEGAAGVAVAGFLQAAERIRGKDVAIVLCGANIGAETLKSVL